MAKSAVCASVARYSWSDEGLGDFLELEVVLRENESTDAGVREAEGLMARLQVQPSQLIDRAYVDLLAVRR